MKILIIVPLSDVVAIIVPSLFIDKQDIFESCAAIFEISSVLFDIIFPTYTWPCDSCGKAIINFLLSPFDIAIIPVGL